MNAACPVPGLIEAIWRLEQHDEATGDKDRPTKSAKLAETKNG